MTDILQSVLGKIETVNSVLIRIIESIGVAALFLIMLLTFVDVLGAKLFLAPIFGSLDIVMLAQIIAIAFAVGSALVVGRHVHVELFLPYIPRILRNWVVAAVHLLSLFLFVIVSLNLFRYGHSLQINGEVSPTAHIALYPFAYAAAAAFIPVCIELFLRTMRTLFRLNT